MRPACEARIAATTAVPPPRRPARRDGARPARRGPPSRARGCGRSRPAPSRRTRAAPRSIRGEVRIGDSNQVGKLSQEELLQLALPTDVVAERRVRCRCHHASLCPSCPPRLPLRRRSVERLACEPDTCRPAGKVQQQEADKLCRLRGGSRRTWGRELLVEGSHLLTRCDGRQHGLEFVVGGPPVARVQCDRLSSEPLVCRLGLRKARRCRVGRRRLGRRGKTFQSKECLRFHALSSMPGQRGFVSERPLLSSATWCRAA